MGNDFSRKENVGFLYFDALSEPTYANSFFGTLDSTLADPSKPFSEEDKAIIENKFPFETTHSGKFRVRHSDDLFLLISTDPKCQIIIDGQIFVVGTGRFTIPIWQAPCSDIDINHEGECKIRHYFLSYELRDMVEIRFNFHLPCCDGSEKKIYRFINCGAKFGEVSEPHEAILSCGYNSIRKQGTTTSAFVYAMNIEELQKHSKMFENEEKWGMRWDKNIIRMSYPPCIRVSVEIAFLEHFMNLLEEICPKHTISGFNEFDMVEVEQTEEDKRIQEESNMKVLLENVQKLIDIGFVHRKN